MSECVGPFEQLAKLRPSRVFWLGFRTREGCTESLFLSLFVCVWTAISQNADLQDDFMIRTRTLPTMQYPNLPHLCLCLERTRRTARAGRHRGDR